MKRRFCMILLLAMSLAYGKVVTTTFVRINSVSILGVPEHTLVIPPDFPEFENGYTGAWDVDFYDADITLPDDPPPDNEETEQDNDGGDDQPTRFRTTVQWSISGPGAAFTEETDTASAHVQVRFTSGNVEDVVLTLKVTCKCISGNGVGAENTCTFTVRSPVWDPYHAIDTVATGDSVLGPPAVAVGDTASFRTGSDIAHEYDRRVGADIQTPLDDIVVRWTLPGGFEEAGQGPGVIVAAANAPQTNAISANVATGQDPGVIAAAANALRANAASGSTVAGQGHDINVVAPDIPMTGAAIAAEIDDAPLPKPDNERGSRDDASYPLQPATVAVVAVESLLPDTGTEVEDGDGNPDTRTFLVPVAATGTITVTATPNPPTAEANLPEAWTLTGGTGTGKLQRTIDISAPGVHTLLCECGTSSRTTTVLVYRIALTNIKFNHDTGSTQGDAINLRLDHDTAFDISDGEWTSHGVSVPACYVANRRITIKARFEVAPQAVTSAVIGAVATGESLKSLTDRTVNFSNGVSTPEYVSFNMQGTTSGCLMKSTNEILEWNVSSVNGAGTPSSVIETTMHTIYTILGDPKKPWSNAVDNPQNAWTRALDFVIDTAECNEISTPENALSRITSFLFSGHGLTYDVKDGKHKYANSYQCSHFYLSGYIEKTNGNVINCYDQVGGICILGCLAGIDVTYEYMDRFGYINTTNIIGRGPCNNPFYMSNYVLIHLPIVGADYVIPNRTGFGNHAFATYNRLVFDACAGPYKGEKTIQSYINSTIDKSTQQEQQEAGDMSNLQDPAYKITYIY